MGDRLDRLDADERDNGRGAPVLSHCQATEPTRRASCGMITFALVRENTKYLAVEDTLVCWKPITVVACRRRLTNHLR